MTDTKHTAYKQGFIDGVTAFAWWDNGVQRVGTSGLTLAETLATLEKIFNYNPPVNALDGLNPEAVPQLIGVLQQIDIGVLSAPLETKEFVRAALAAVKEKE